MAPIAITTSHTSPPGVSATKASFAANRNQGLNLDTDGTSTPYSTTSTAVSEFGGDHSKSPISKATPQFVVDDNLPSVTSSPTDCHFFTNLISSSQPVPTTKAGATVFGSAIDVLEAFAIKSSAAVWVYDDAVQVGFGSKIIAWNEQGAYGTLGKVHTVQSRQGAGLEIAGFVKKAAHKGKISVFATTSTLPLLTPHLSAIEGDIVIHIASTEPSPSLELSDALSSPGVLKALTALPEDWTVIFSSGSSIVPSSSQLYSTKGKVIHIVESTYSGRQTTSFNFPSSESVEEFTVSDEYASELYLTVASHAALTLADKPLVTLNTLTPSPEALLVALTKGGKKTVTVTGPTQADAEALKALVLATLFSAPQSSSSSSFPTIKAAVTPLITSTNPPGKTISFYSAPLSPLPELLAHLFLSSPSLATNLAQYGSTSSRGVKSVLSISSGAVASITPNSESDVIWVSDPNILKSTDVLASAKKGAILVLDLPWLESEIPVKLSAREVQTIKEKQLRVFLLDLDSNYPLNPIRQQVAFLLLYTGQKRLPQGIWRVLDTFYSNQLGRDEVEDAQGALSEIPQAEIAEWEVDPETVKKTKSVWSWDALPGQAGIISLDADDKPTLSSWQLAARHVLFREAFSVPDGKTVDAEVGGPGIKALRPSTADETFLVTVSENRRLTPVSYDRNVFHLELDTSGTGLKYEIGEAIGIHGWNDSQEVVDFCSWYGLDPDALVSFPNPTQSGTRETRTIFQLLQQNVDLFGRPGKAFYAALAKLATARAEAMTLKFISAPEGAELFKKMAENETVTFADVLQRFRTARPSIEELIGLIPEIKPRHYSIASSQKAVGDKVELLIVTVDWIDSKGSPRFGQCTRYLAGLKPGAKVTVSIKPSVMKLSPDDRQPIIMAGLGTGAAPFRAFMQHRAWQRSQGIEVGPLIYYFGSRYRSQEYLYGEEIEAYIAAGIISHAGLAFSRDGKDKVYIQHKMKQDKKMLAKMLMGKGKDAAYFYLCGPTWPVPDVYEALVSSLTEESGMDRKAAEEYIEALKEDERYVLEVY